MQIKIITLPVLAEEAEQEELNVFLRSHKIVDVRRELAQSADGCYWTFCITFLPSVKSEGRERFSNGEKQSKIDYKDVLDPVSFERFSRMRRLRKEIAESEAIPAYAVFTDAELADMARLEVHPLSRCNPLHVVVRSLCGGAMQAFRPRPHRGYASQHARRNYPSMRCSAT